MNFDNLTTNMFGMGGFGGVGMLSGGAGTTHQQLPACKKAHEVRKGGERDRNGEDLAVLLSLALYLSASFSPLWPSATRNIHRRN